MGFRIGILVSLFLVWSTQSFALDLPHYDNKFFDLRTAELLRSWDDLKSTQIHPGQVIIMAENHGVPYEHLNQMKFLAQLKTAGFSPVSVAMEFFDYTKQEVVDQYLARKLSDEDFKTKIQWGGEDFTLYKYQILSPILNGGKTYAINLPSRIAAQILEAGIAGLSPDNAKMLSPQFHLGRDSYRKRVYAAIPQVHSSVTPEYYESFFAAMSAWDDTMAWKISQAMTENPLQILVVIVGNFHANYGGGLQDRLHAYGVKDILTIHQIDLRGQPLDNLNQMVQPDPKYGRLTDLIWITGNPTQ